MPVTLRYTYRLRPGRNAVRVLEREWSVCRCLWNQAVAAKRQRRYWLADKNLTRLLTQHEWLAAGLVVAQHQVGQQPSTRESGGRSVSGWPSDPKHPAAPLLGPEHRTSLTRRKHHEQLRSPEL